MRATVVNEIHVERANKRRGRSHYSLPRSSVTSRRGPPGTRSRSERSPPALPFSPAPRHNRGTESQVTARQHVARR
ncbi:unnamed protein product [Danaus chrysippus]|uniref:(African queen) hypothetical protein n=1 Tax=Danaus chrysippus TaxID=151541 RepID=A0A8J2WDI5_9NEOP|nr:unnamed protein product [Danaus chrysippus]